MKIFVDFEKDYLQPIKKHFISKDRDFKVNIYLVLSYERERHLLFFLHSVPTISVWYIQCMCLHSLYISLFGDVHT